MEPGDDPQTYEGCGKTEDLALIDAATKALDADYERNLGREFQIVEHYVTIENPRISEHRVKLNG